MYLVAATSVGHAHAPQTPVNAPTIFDRLDQKGISWKIYITDPQLDTEMGFFAGFISKHRDKFVPVSQYFTDVQNGTLPSVAYIDPGFTIGADEHPGKGNNIQTGAAFLTSLIKALIQSQSWKDSVFIMVFDEAGGLYDHVPSPTNVPSPDGIPPQDLFTGNPPDPNGNFTRYGFRIPNLIVSPFTRKHFVSHTVTDSTAILKFIETRFGLQPLTNRDALAMDMRSSSTLTTLRGRLLRWFRTSLCRQADALTHCRNNRTNHGKRRGGRPRRFLFLRIQMHLSVLQDHGSPRQP